MVIQERSGISSLLCEEISGRIQELKDLASEEGVTCSEKSEHDLIYFLSVHALRTEPVIFLLDNGNFHAYWKRGNFPEREQVGLEFLGGDRVLYVLFGKDGEEATQRTGTCAFGEALRKIDDLGLRVLFAS